MEHHISTVISRESSVVKAVCFATEKHQSLEAMAVQKSPVKIQNYTISRKYGREGIVIGKKTSIVPTEAAFDYESMNKDITIASLSQVAPDPLLHVKGTVKDLTAVKIVMFNKNPVKKQCYIVDPSGFIKLIILGFHYANMQYI